MKLVMKHMACCLIVVATTLSGCATSPRVASVMIPTPRIPKLLLPTESAEMLATKIIPLSREYADNGYTRSQFEEKVREILEERDVELLSIKYVNGDEMTLSLPIGRLKKEPPPYPNKMFVADPSDTKALPKSHASGVKSLAISPDGKLLASGDLNGSIKLWSLSEGMLLTNLWRESGRQVSMGVWSLAFSPDGHLLVAGGGTNAINLWTIPDGRYLATLMGHSRFVTSLAISPDGKLLASGACDSTIKLWALPEGQLLNTLKWHSNTVDSLAISPDGQFLVSVAVTYNQDNRSIALWSLPKGTLLSVLPPRERDMKNGGDTGTTHVESLAISPDGKTLVSAGGNNSSEVLDIWSLPQGQLIRSVHDEYTRRTPFPLLSLAISPDGKVLASGAHEGGITLRSLPEGRFETMIKAHDGAQLYCVIFSRDGNVLISSGNDGRIYVWELTGRGRCWLLFDPALKGY